MRYLPFMLLLTGLLFSSASFADNHGGVGVAVADDPDESQRPRLIILADIGNEPDEEQQMSHMLVNCNEFALEGLIAVTGKFLNENAESEFKRAVHPELFHKLIDGYARVEANLRLHAGGWQMRWACQSTSARYTLSYST